jgi:hypothetical protein
VFSLKLNDRTRSRSGPRPAGAPNRKTSDVAPGASSIRSRIWAYSSGLLLMATGRVPDRMLHNLRRSAIRRMVCKDISETVAMKLSGHKTMSVFRRYDITSTEDLRDAAQRLES